MRKTSFHHIVSALTILAGGALFSACSQPPTQITINANSSADKTTTYTTTNSIHSKESNSVHTTSNLTESAAKRDSTVEDLPANELTIPSPTATATAEPGTCTWNGQPEQCRATWLNKTATVTWLSDNKVTQYDFSAGTVFDSANGMTYQAIRFDYSSGCITTQNGSTCIYK